MSYERVVTLPFPRGPYSTRATMIGALPALALTATKVGGAIFGALGRRDPEKAARTALAREIAAQRTPEQMAADAAATRAAFARRGIGTGIARIFGRFPTAPVTVKRPRRPDLGPLPAQPVVATPPPAAVPPAGPPLTILEPSTAQPFTASGGGGGGGSPAVTEAESTDEQPKTADPAKPGILPVVLLGGLALWAFSRRRKR